MELNLNPPSAGYMASRIPDCLLHVTTEVIAAGVVVKAASPIDLIPDFIPVLGHVDDLLVAIIGGVLLLRSVPRRVVEEHLREYEVRAEDKRHLETTT